MSDDTYQSRRTLLTGLGSALAVPTAVASTATAQSFSSVDESSFESTQVRFTDEQFGLQLDVTGEYESSSWNIQVDALLVYTGEPDDVNLTLELTTQRRIRERMLDIEVGFPWGISASNNRYIEYYRDTIESDINADPVSVSADSIDLPTFPFIDFDDIFSGYRGGYMFAEHSYQLTTRETPFRIQADGTITYGANDASITIRI